MPRIARTFIKTGLIYFVAALLLALDRQLGIVPFPVMAPLFWHLLMVGWVTQIIFGVSMWMFPGRTREDGFQAQKWAWLTYLFLNTGLVLRLVAEPLAVSSSSAIWNMGLSISAAAQLIAAICYVIELWPRIQSKKQRRQRRKKTRGKNHRT